MQITTNCPRCGKEFSRTYRGTVPKFCSQTCQHDFWVTNNRERHNAAVRRYRARRYKEEGKWLESGPKVKALKEWMVQLKSKPCHDCGGSFPVCCMDFDHRIGTIKVYNLGSMFAHHYSMELIESELEKCDLVCANCHRIRTRDRRTGSGKSHLQFNDI
jgi:hypothetical protein